MTDFRTHVRLAAWSGLWAPASLWALNMQLGQVLPYMDCARQIRSSAVISIAATVLAMLSGYVSWRSVRPPSTGFGSPPTLRFVGNVSALSALIFAFALIMQTIASLVLTGCER
jgi:hypothetical protein